MIELKKKLVKGYKNGSGFVRYCAIFNSVQIYVCQINEVMKIISKDFPNITEEHVWVYIVGNKVECNFYTLNLKEKLDGFFDEQNII